MKLFTTIAFCLMTGVLLNAQSLPVNKGHLKKLVRTMAGAFGSEQQSKEDSAYFHIALHMTPMWQKNSDGYWLYVEQAMATMQDKPYRQRVYHVYIENDTTIVSKVYELSDPVTYVGAWKTPEKLASITPAMLVDRQGCAISLYRQPEGSYRGATPGKQCLSSLRGATYATSEVVICRDRMVSWDRGWDANDKQVWGAVKGGYIFVKE